MKTVLSECMYAALIAVAVFSSSAHAQQASPRDDRSWLWGFQLGQGARGADAFFDTSWRAYDSGGSDRRCQSHEYALSAHAGRFISNVMHFDAVLGGRVGGSGCLPGLGPVPFGDYREFQYVNSPGDQFATTSARIMLEPGPSEAVFRPRASVAMGLILGKWDPTATIAGGAGIGSAKTRFTIDIGEQFYWIGYQLRVRNVVNNQMVEEHIETGTQKPHGLSVQVGIQHAF